MKRPPTDATPPIYLMGMMGSGKSTLGRALAGALARPFVDLDERIERRAGLTISEIFQRYGESRFRDLESAALAEVRLEPGVVVALGGGTPTRAANRELLSAGGCVVYLRARPDTLVERLPDATDRPLLRDTTDRKRTLRELLAEREPLYDDLADVIVDNEDDATDVLDRLMDELRTQGWLHS